MGNRRVSRMKYFTIIIAGLLSCAWCSPSQVKELCCPAACAIKHSDNWYRADSVLRGCMQGIRCDKQDLSHATVNEWCNC